MSFFPLSHPNSNIPTGSLGLDLCLGSGGYLPGAIIEISGLQECGKTTLCLHAAAQAQRQRKTCAWIDADPCFSVQYASQCGINQGEIFYSSPGTLEQALDTLLILSKASAFELIILDSLFGLMMGLGSTAGGELQGLDYAYISEAMTAIDNAVKKNGTIILITDAFDPSLSSTYHHLAGRVGELSIKLHTSVHIRLSSVEITDKLGACQGQRITARIIKNRVISPINSSEFDIIINRGINKEAEIFHLGLAADLISKRDQGYFFKSAFLGKTQDEAIGCLYQKEEISAAAERAIRRKYLPDNFSAAA